MECEAGKKREDGRIDIFIHDVKYGIIIENKINSAQDQQNQLAKYLKFAKGMGKEIIAVVYIPPPYKNSEPPLESYEESFQAYIPEIREKLIILPVVNTHDKKDLVHGFLGRCLELPENNERQNYILSQYAKLLISIKGAEAMTQDVDMALLAECYKDKNSISIMENLAEVWSNRYCLLGGILLDTMRERLINELGFSIDPEDENGLYKQINNNIYLYFFNDSNDSNSYYFGFYFEVDIDSGIKDKLRETLDQVMPPAYFADTTAWGNPEYCLVKWFRIVDYKEPLSKIADYLIGRYRLLEEKARKEVENT